MGFLWVWKRWVFVGWQDVAGWWSGNVTGRRELSEADLCLVEVALLWCFLT